MSASTYIGGEERAAIRRMRQEGMSVDEIVIVTGRSNTSVHEIVRDMEVVVILKCGWCSEKFTHQSCSGRPPGYCCDEHRYHAALKRKRDARSKEAE